MEGPDVVLALGQIDPGLAAVGRIDLGDERRRHLDDRDTALVDRRAESDEIAGDAATEGEQRILAADAGARELTQQRLRLAEALRLLPAGDLDRSTALDHRHQPAGGREGVAIGEPEQAGARAQIGSGAVEQLRRAGADERRIRPVRSLRPVHPDAGGRAQQSQPGGGRDSDRFAAGRQDDAAAPLVEGLPRPVAAA